MALNRGIQRAAPLAAEMAASMRALEELHPKRVDEIAAEGEMSRVAAQQAHDQEVAQLRRQFEAGARIPYDQHQRELIAHGLPVVDWSDQAWQKWSTHATQAAPSITRFGALSLNDGTQRWTFPALTELPHGNLLIEASGQGKTAAAAAVGGLLLRLLATVPPGQLRFTFIDPIGLGQNVTPFLSLRDHREELVTSRAWTESRHIDQQLEFLSEHIETVIQQHLRSDYATVEDYNKTAAVPEPYRLLVVFDFPTNFSESAARRLVSIAANGPRCGVAVIVVVDTEKPRPHGFALDDLERVATVIAWDGERFIWQDDDFRDCVLEFDTPPSADLFKAIVEATGKAAVAAGQVRAPFEQVAPQREDWWSRRSIDGIEVALGPKDATRSQNLVLDDHTPHALLVGRTGSGKSTLLHTLITNAALTYRPNEIELYLMDFKVGVEFKTYAMHRLPHAMVIAIESEREFGLSVLRGLVAELEWRGNHFRAAAEVHGEVRDITAYRRKSGETLPRILLIVDEFQQLFAEDDRLAGEAVQLLDRLVRQGRSFGIHLLLASQTLRGAFGMHGLPNSILGQIHVRVALQCTAEDSRLILADDNIAARGLSRPGAAIYNDHNGLVEGNHDFQVAWLPDEERDTYLTAVRALADECEYRPPKRQRIFEGNAPAELEANEVLTSALECATWPTRQRAPKAWLGEPIALSNAPTAAIFNRQSGSNLLVLGQDVMSAAGMLAAALVSLAVQQSPDDARFIILDYTPAEAACVDLWTDLRDNLLPHRLTIAGRRGLPEVVTQLDVEVKRRLDDGVGGPSIYLFVFGLQRARDLRKDDDALGSFSFASSLGDEPPAPPSPANLFPTILREGPDLGVHTLVWCDTVANLERTLDRRTMREFDMRVVLQMPAQDSTHLIDSPLANSLGPNRCLYYSEEEGKLEKFRPYGLPTREWLSGASTRLGIRANIPVNGET